LKETVIC